MKFKKLLVLHTMLKDQICDDFVYSLVLDSGQYMIAVSCHKSEKYKFNHNRNIQTCALTEQDLDRPITQLVASICALYKSIMVEKTIEDVEKLETAKKVFEKLQKGPQDVAS